MSVDGTEAADETNEGIMHMTTSSTCTGAMRSRRGRSRWHLCLAVVAAAALVACGDDDDDAAGTTVAESAAPDSTAAAGGDTDGGDSDGGDSDNGDSSTGASGAATFSTADLTIEGGIVACEIANETDLTMTVEGENAGFQVTSTGAGGDVAVTVTGGAEFEGSGQATVSDSGEIAVNGQGSEPDDDAAVVDFTITGTIESC